MPIYSSVAVYKALYKSFGGFAADVVAAIDQVPVICWVFLQTITYQTVDESSVAFLNQNGNNFVYMYPLPFCRIFNFDNLFASRLLRMGLT